MGGCLRGKVHTRQATFLTLVITQACAFVDRNVITQSSTNQIHPTKILWTSNFMHASLPDPPLFLRMQGSGFETM